ncbi:MAG: hypothetical protein OEY44_00165 [Candidatus Peregrinibacteria bacterium]|nr:hypothetical protein [Candidatus Peregrinibacteria bacterium]
MNESTQFLAQLMGPILALIGVALITRKKAFREFVSNLAEDPSLLLYNGMLESSAGLAVILHHNLWNTIPEIIVSILGWGMLIEGALDLFITKKNIKQYARSINDSMMNLSSVLMIVAGAYLSYAGYLPA